MENGRPVKQIWEAQIHAKRTRGRSRAKWDGVMDTPPFKGKRTFLERGGAAGKRQEGMAQKNTKLKRTSLQPRE